jgi:hypothetical protein
VASDRPEQLQLVQELGSWTITLKSGEVLEVGAHSYSEKNDVYCFAILMEGTPPFYVDVLRIPATLVEKVRGG